MGEMELLHEEITNKILKAYFKVYNTLGYGFLEKVYENALAIELKKNGLTCERRHPIEVFYNERSVGMYVADIVVDNAIILEIKAGENLKEEHEYQLLNYLKATELNVGLLLNFGPRPQFKRKIFTSLREV
jgi:GxxExxY protein